MSGRSLPRPTNYALSRIVPPPGVATDPRKWPLVAMIRGRPGAGYRRLQVGQRDRRRPGCGPSGLFIGSAWSLHLASSSSMSSRDKRGSSTGGRASRRCAASVCYRHCQAGYQTLMVAMLRPDLFGPCLVAGAPMPYWQGVHGKNPMRYSGGLLGGSWLTAMKRPWQREVRWHWG